MAPPGSRVEFFIEKEAMVGVVAPVTRQYAVSLIPIRGQCSETWCWSVAQDWNRLDPLDHLDHVNVYYIGDHDPAGFDIERSLMERITGYLDDEHKECFSWERLAVTMEDFENGELLGFPVKRNPKQPNGSWARYLGPSNGDRCVEADAISANEIRSRVEAAIRSHIVEEMWDTTMAVQEEEQTEISRKLGLT